MKENILMILRITLFILFISFYPYLIFETEKGNLTGILDAIGSILWIITLIVGMITIFIWVLKKLKFIKGRQ